MNNDLSCVDVARIRITQLAAALVADGLPVDVVLSDVRAACEPVESDRTVECVGANA